MLTKIEIKTKRYPSNIQCGITWKDEDNYVIDSLVFNLYTEIEIESIDDIYEYLAIFHPNLKEMLTDDEFKKLANEIYWYF